MGLLGRKQAKEDATQKAVVVEEVTGPQVRGDRTNAEKKSTYYNAMRGFRHDPTIALTRMASVAPILAATWTVTADDDAPNGAKELIEETFLPVRPNLLEHILFYGYIDYGWAGFEKVWEERDGLFTIKKFKPLLHDITKILADKETGGFHGYEQPKQGGNVTVDLAKSLHYPFRMEGQNWYGESLYVNVIEVMDAYRKTEAFSKKYDEKVASSFRVLHYKAGNTLVNGVKQDASVAANAILDTLKSGGDLAIPHTEKDQVNGEDPWRFEYVGSGGSAQYGFVARATYLDKLKVRGMLWPERAILEGEHGTKADAEAHGSVPLTVAELVHEDVTRNTNWHAVNQVLVANWGESAANKVRLIADPIVDEKRVVFANLLNAMIANPTTFVEVFSRLDLEAIIDQVGIPQSGDEIPMRVPTSVSDGAQFALSMNAYSDRIIANASAG